MPDIKRTILLFSLEPWGDMWYSKQHYAWELAKEHNVFFISPPDGWRLRDLFKNELKVEQVNPGLSTVRYSNMLPLRVLPKTLAQWVQQRTATRLSRLLAHGSNVLWCFYPEALALQKSLHAPGTQLLYHVVDPYQTFPEDVPMAKAADLIVAVNPWFEQHYEQWNPHTILVPHGVRAEDREHDPQAAAAFRQRWAPYVILAGGLNEHVNYSLLSALADALPQVKLVLAGQRTTVATREQAAFWARSNVVHAGIAAPGQLRDMIAGAFAGLVAYRFGPNTGKPGRTPLKAVSYLAQSKPVVSTIDCHIPELDGISIFRAHDQEEFIDTVKGMLNGTIPIQPGPGQRYLDSVSYTQLTRRILGAMVNERTDR